MAAVVRYLVDDVDTALPFYRALGFKLAERWGPPFAIVKRRGLALWLSGPGTSARKKLAGGALPAPGGWNRLVIEVADLDATLARLTALTEQGAVFRSKPIKGPGGRQVLVNDPSGNPVELFEPRGEAVTVAASPLPAVTVRQAAFADLDRLVPLFDAHRQHQGQPADEAAARAFLHARFEHGQSVVFIAEDAEDALGFAQLYPSFSSVSLARVFVLNDLFVAESARRSHVASALLDAVESYAWAMGAARVTLNVARDNGAGRALYTARGWQQDEQFFMFHRFPRPAVTAVQPAAGVQRLRAATLAGLAALVLLGLAWELWLVPIGRGTLALKVLPLAFALPGVWRHRMYTYRWLSLLVWLYFGEGVLRATTDRGVSQALAALEVLLALALFAACTLYIRRRLKSAAPA